MINLLTGNSKKMIAKSKLDSFALSNYGVDSSSIQIVISGNGTKFVLAFHGGLWKGDVKTGNVKQITHLLYYTSEEFIPKLGLLY